MENIHSQSSTVFNQKLDDFSDSFNERKNANDKLIQTKVNEMLFSVNIAIHGQIEMLEFDPLIAKEAINSVNDIRSNLNRNNKKLKNLKDTIIQIAANMSNQKTPSFINRKNAPHFVKSVAESNEKRMDSIQKEYTALFQKLKKFKTIFYKVLPLKKRNLPQFSKSPLYSISQAPRFPQLPQITSAIDYFDYLSQTIPYSQSVIKEFHYFLSQVNNSLSNKTDITDFEQFRTEIKDIYLLHAIL